MTDRYVGPGGSDGNSGLTWALRKLTLNGVEDTPVVAGDTIYVGPGVYREMLTVDVSGSSGNPITFIGDVTGENTDGIGGIVRISGSNNDDSYPNIRDRCIHQLDKNYRTYRGFYFGECRGAEGSIDHYIWIFGTTGAVTNNIIEFCYFATSCQSGAVVQDYLVPIRIYQTNSGTASNNIIRNCIFMPSGGGAIVLQEGGGKHDWGTIIENNIIYGANGQFIANIWINSGYGHTIRGNTFIGDLPDALGATIYSLFGVDSQYSDIYDNVFIKNTDCMYESVSNTLNEDYNFICGSTGSLGEGANDVTSYLPQTAPILSSGYRFPWTHVDISQYNDNIYMTDSQALTKDVYGLTRPGNNKRTRGAVQFKGVMRDSDEYKIYPSSMRMDDASKYIVSIPVTDGGKVRVTVHVKRETNYAGTAPQLVLRLPTQSAVTVTDTGSTGSYNRLVGTVTPSAADRWLQIEFRSNNTATTGDYKVWFDDFRVQAKTGLIPQVQWVTNEIPLFCFAMATMVDPWITPTIPVPYIAPVYSQFHPMPSFRRSGI